MDLNRNFLTAEQWELALGRDPNFANYVDAMDYLSPSHNPFPRGMDLLNELHYVAIMSKVIFTNMMGKMKRALLSGNYHFHKGLGFGGREPSQSFKNLDGFLKSEELGLYVNGAAITDVKKFALVDVHTGLGPAGVDTLSHEGLAKANLNDAEAAYFEAHFPLEMSGTGDDAKVIGGIKSTSDQGGDVFAGYDLMMGDVDGYCRNQLFVELGAANPRSKVCTTQEFGTYSNTIVGIVSSGIFGHARYPNVSYCRLPNLYSCHETPISQALVSENHMFHYGSKVQQQEFSGKLKKVFYLRNKQWTRAVVHRGMEVLLQVAICLTIFVECCIPTGNVFFLPLRPFILLICLYSFLLFRPLILLRKNKPSCRVI